MTDDFYDLLEVSPDAPQEEIKKAFRKQVRIYHPDLNDDDRARAQFTALKKAYDILGDPVERRAYDRLGHEDYVAKRTSGLPSPDVWKRVDSDSSTDTKATATTPGTAGATGTVSETGPSSTGASASEETDASASAATDASASAASKTATSTKKGTATSTGGREHRYEETTRSGTGSATHVGGAGAESASGGGRWLTDNAFARWWHRRRFSGPLIWISFLVYLAGLGHFGFENEDPLQGIISDVLGIGGDPGAQWSYLTGGRYGLETIVGFLVAVEPFQPLLPEMEWYGVLVGIVVFSLIIVLAARVAWRLDPWGPITFTETIIVALGLAVSTTIVGGPLLAGIVLMPLLFGVVVHRTRQLPGWGPSYLYVLCVCAPLIGLIAGTTIYPTLLLDLVAFAVLPVVGGLGLPLRVSIRKRFGR